MGIENDDNKEIFFADDATDASMELAASIHPAWDKCTTYARQLHGRNCMQVLGTNLKTPSTAVAVWTPGGKKVGGSATVLSLAEMHSIPVFNFGDSNRTAEDTIKICLEFLKEQRNE